MNDLEKLARDVMSAVDISLTENFVRIVLFSRDNPELAVLGIGKKKFTFGNRDHLEWLADKYVKGRDPKPLPVPSTVPDPALALVMIRGYLVNPDEVDSKIDGHRWAMVAENVVGNLLERFIDSKLDDDDWIWCAGEVVKRVDFIRESKKPGLDWESLQIKNRDNSENSSSSAIRQGTDIQKWYRTKSKTGTTRWDLFPANVVGSHLTEHGFHDFIAKYIGTLHVSD